MPVTLPSLAPATGSDGWPERCLAAAVRAKMEKLVLLQPEGATKGTGEFLLTRGRELSGLPAAGSDGGDGQSNRAKTKMEETSVSFSR